VADQVRQHLAHTQRIADEGVGHIGRHRRDALKSGESRRNSASKALEVPSMA